MYAYFFFFWYLIRLWYGVSMCLFEYDDDEDENNDENDNEDDDESEGEDNNEDKNSPKIQATRIFEESPKRNTPSSITKDQSPQQEKGGSLVVDNTKENQYLKKSFKRFRRKRKDFDVIMNDSILPTEINELSPSGDSADESPPQSEPSDIKACNKCIEKAEKRGVKISRCECLLSKPERKAYLENKKKGIESFEKKEYEVSLGCLLEALDICDSDAQLHEMCMSIVKNCFCYFFEFFVCCCCCFGSLFIYLIRAEELFATLDSFIFLSLTHGIFTNIL
ncbi:hypothetical protein RFI_16289 [Reticulomyxa filosa]|uniref:Uncharacterized protein n=1 Tax=Reticulomyxa filosa TaxID=46433 RepID=X6N4U8_RETFI|nr:hypothetical protein RFI_16289 [Reticulomyxa filosa]|eukprot:ETO20918.1 hypothetical protein RFI_16289 [Reticulomyxa filosa]